MDKAAPALNPNKMLSLIKLIRELSLKMNANKQMTATVSAVRAAMPAQSLGSPPERTATVEPIISEMDEVGPTATCLDVVKMAKTNPAAKQQ